MPLRPLLCRGMSSMKNIEDNVHTLKVEEDNYLMVHEDEPGILENVNLL